MMKNSRGISLMDIMAVAALTLGNQFSPTRTVQSKPYKEPSRKGWAQTKIKEMFLSKEDKSRIEAAKLKSSKFLLVWN